MVYKDYDTIKKAENIFLDNRVALSFEPGAMNHADERQVYEAARRFLCMAKAAPEDGFLGWQAQSAPDGTFSSSAFTSMGLKASKEDLDWIFRECAEADDFPTEGLKNVFSADKKLYVLAPYSDRMIDPSDSSKDCFDDTLFYDDPESSISSDQVDEFVEMIAESSAEILAIAYTSKNVRNHGLILIRLPDEIPLRMRGMISLAFSDLSAYEFHSMSKDEIEKRLLPDDHFTAILSNLLLVFIRRYSEKKRNDKKNGKNDNTDKSDTSEMGINSGSQNAGRDECETDLAESEEKDAAFTPLYKLELGPRAINHLRHEGIRSIEDLQAMSEYDLLHIKNLGRKCLAEIKEKLAEYLSEHPDAVKSTEIKSKNYYSMLNELIGLSEVKEQIKKVAAYSKMQHDLSTLHTGKRAITLNMEFTGNPGTAKTTVARITAGILHELGLLPEAEMIEVGRADLVGKYEGQTAILIKELFQKAKGRVLFIDEAYSLLETWEGAYGDEAISSIVQEMENNRENTIVIFAGYPEKMKRFFARNPGLRSRVPFSIHFKDYSAEEMVEIVQLEVKKMGFSISSEALEKVMSICSAAAGDPEAGNGRLCRNIAENALLEYALRTFGENGNPEENDQILKASDFSIPAGIEPLTKPARIGF